ncbi:MAG: hypothetical protein E6K70_25910, partial [Planctomycetota bacterium]
MPLRLSFKLGEDRLGLARGFNTALLGLRVGLDQDPGALGLGRRLHGGPPFRLDALGLGQSRLGHGPILGLLHGRLGLALARLAHLECLCLLDLQVGLGQRHLGLSLSFAGDRLGIGARQGDAHLPLRILDLGFALEAGRLFADLLLLVELGHAHGLLALGFAGA